MNLVVGFLVGVICGLILVSIWRLKRNGGRTKYFAVCEYWVYLPGEKMPAQDQVMTMMVSESPYRSKGHVPIGSREGVLFSDIRLHCTLVLRSKNPHVFRPDLFVDVEVKPETLKALSKAQSLVKLRYLSEEPLADDRHLQFMPHLADAYTRMGEGVAVYDVVAERLMQPDELQTTLNDHPLATGPEVHLRTAWLRGDGVARAETRGMLKRGLPELVSADARTDNQRLVCEVLHEAATMAFRRGEVFATEIVEYFGDQFEVRAMPERERKRLVHIVRYQAV